ncbi:MAG: RCC1 repeat-containing protein, partial [Acidimicrobiia bacterium]|nr:RCC1 repeat-containing protein [Acidimicrobiia bacterium]
RQNHSVWCWGLNDFGQLGDNSTDDSSVPVMAVGFGRTDHEFVSLAGGGVHACGVTEEGAAWCWGRNDKGQLGDNSTTDHDVPVQVVGAGGAGWLTDVVEIGAGLKHSCALKSDSTVWCWGLNDKGQLGDNSTTQSLVPVQVVGAGGVGVLSGVIDVVGGEGHSCAALSDGTAWCWGLNDKGQLGDNSTTQSLVPVQVAGAGGVGVLSGVASVGAGLKHSCAAKSDGTAWCWGLNDKGQLGDNSTTQSLVPVQVVGAGGVGVLGGVSDVVAGAGHSCSAKSDGTAWCWGLNDKGQLGDNSTTQSLVPVQVVGAGGVGVLGGTVQSVSGLKHNCAALSDGTVWCWGLNDKGQLGDNTTTDSSVPVQVVGPGGVGVLDAVVVDGGGDNHTCAARQNHSVWCWGLNDFGQLGDNSTDDSSVPVMAVGT